MPIRSLKTKTPPSPYSIETNAVVVFADGTTFYGQGIGATGNALGEICFNTSMTGYQEILTDPSYAGQIINFTFPHIGNVGTNDEDIEAEKPYARGLIIRQDISTPSSWRAIKHFDEWLQEHNIVGICGLDTRAMTRHIRDKGAPNAVIYHKTNPQEEFDLEALQNQAAGWSGLEGLDLAKDVSCQKPYEWNQASWSLKDGYATQNNSTMHVVAMDFGAKRNILRCLSATGCKVTVVPGTTSAEDILKMKPDGVFLSNGPGDPAATGEYAVPTIQALMEKDIPLFGICLGHQMLALAFGAKTEKMHLGHRGANQPVKDLTTGKVEITSQNHGFCVIADSLPDDVDVTHISLFDNSNEGIAHKTKPAFSVQHHPEASPGPQDSHYLFDRFVDMMKKKKK